MIGRGVFGVEFDRRRRHFLVGDQMRIRSVRFEIYRRECGALDLTKALLAFAIASGIRKPRTGGLKASFNTATSTAHLLQPLRSN